MNLYIDESGSMTTTNINGNPYFVISMVAVNDSQKVKRYFKRFVSKNLSELKRIDCRKKMFEGDKFKELKGSELIPKLKKEFMTSMFRENCLKVFYIVLDNQSITPNFYLNTARAFNYCIKLALSYYLRTGKIGKEINNIEIDERNERTKTKFFLEEYLNTELLLHEGVLDKNISVQYFDSSQNIYIQIADVLANIKYSDLLTCNYNKELNDACYKGYIKKDFVFPQKVDRTLLTSETTYDILYTLK